MTLNDAKELFEYLNKPFSDLDGLRPPLASDYRADIIFYFPSFLKFLESKSSKEHSMDSHFSLKTLRVLIEALEYEYGVFLRTCDKFVPEGLSGSCCSEECSLKKLFNSVLFFMNRLLFRHNIIKAKMDGGL